MYHFLFLFWTFFPIASGSLVAEEDLLSRFVASSSTSHKQGDDVYKYLDGVWSVTTVEGGNRSSTTTPFGYSNIPFQIPMSEDSHFPIASNSKLFTAVAIYQLYEQGKLDVNADIATMLDAHDFANFGLQKPRKFCPRIGGSHHYFAKCEKISLRNLMSMSSGIFPSLNCDADVTSPDQCNPDPFIVSRGSIGRTVGTFLLKPLMFKPGTAYHYSNPNFILAAYFVEKYSGMTFRDYLQTNIFSPIGLNNTYFDFFNGGLGLDPKRVEQYAKYYDNTTTPPNLMSVGKDVLQLDLGIASGTGGVISTAHDYVTFWYALFNKTTKGAPLVSEASQRALLTPWNLAFQRDDWIYPNGTRHPIWSYYTQGTCILCDAENCPDGPRWIAYTGGDVTVLTANVMDYHTFRMAQVWTSTLVAMTDGVTFDAAFRSQIGFPMNVIGPWLLPEFNNPFVLAFWKLYGKEEDSNHGDRTTLA